MKEIREKLRLVHAFGFKKRFGSYELRMRRGDRRIACCVSKHQIKNANNLSGLLQYICDGARYKLLCGEVKI